MITYIVQPYKLLVWYPILIYNYSVIHHMATFNVTPTGPGGRNDWKVEKNGRKLSEHRTQGAAENKAKRKASAGDTINVHGRNGRVRDSRTVR